MTFKPAFLSPQLIKHDLELQQARSRAHNLGTYTLRLTIEGILFISNYLYI